MSQLDKAYKENDKEVKYDVWKFYEKFKITAPYIEPDWPATEDGDFSRAMAKFNKLNTYRLGLESENTLTCGMTYVSQYLQAIRHVGKHRAHTDLQNLGVMTRGHKIWT